MKKYILVVGAGFAGACYARALAEADYMVTVIDKRPHSGGNAFDFVDDNGIRRHMYGPHLFHTSNTRVVEWLQRFGEWTHYEHRVRALLTGGQFVPLPINLETINSMFGTRLQNEAETFSFLESILVPFPNPANAAEYLYSKIGRLLTDTFFRAYTKKMWGMDLEEMDAGVVKRIPIRGDLEDRYFPNDSFQMLPTAGYSALFDSIFSHENIKVQLNTAFEKRMENDYFHCFSSMPIDEYFECILGELPYRSIRFHHRSSPTRAKQAWATTNFTDNGPLTRETHWHLLPNHLATDTGRYTVTTEEPCDYKENAMERYYPVKTADGRYDAIYQKYRVLAELQANITFVGRCGTYQYLDMHQVINQSLTGAAAWIRAR